MTRARDVATQGGLVLLNTTTFTNASAVNIDNIFTTSYRDYRVVFECTASTGVDIYIRFRANGTTTTSNYAHALAYGETGNGYWGRDANSNWIQGFIAPGRTLKTSSMADIINPKGLTPTTYTYSSYGFHGGVTSSWIGGGCQFDNTSFDGFTYYPGTGTITGNIKIFGYKD